MNKIKLSITTLLVVGLFTACDNNKNNDETIQKENVNSISGVVVDGYIKNATVCIDINLNNKCDKNEPTTITNDKGYYELDISKLSQTDREVAKIISIGGKDITSGNDFNGILKSSLIENEKKINLNPLTTLIARQIKYNQDYKKALNYTSKSLGINNKDINQDIIKNKNKKALEVALKYQKLIEVLNNYLTNEEIEHFKNQIINTMNGSYSMKIIEIINNIDNDKINPYKGILIEMVNSISIKDNDTYENIKKKQKSIENMKNILNNNLNNFKDNEKMDNAFNNPKSNVNKSAILKKIIDNLKTQEKESKVALKRFLDELEMSDFYQDTNNEILYPELYNLNIDNKSTLEDFKAELINNSILNKSLADFIINKIELFNKINN